MKDKKKRKGIELLKSILIVALTLSALELLGRAQLLGSASFSLPGWIAGFLQDLGGGPAQTGGPGERVDPGSGLRPVCLAVNNDSGRYGVHYDTQQLTAAFEAQLGGLLGEALAYAQTPYPVSETLWREALAQGKGVYYDFLGRVPLSALSAWLGGESNPVLTDSARRLLLVLDASGTAVVYYSDEEAGRYRACTTSEEVALLLAQAVDEYVPNNAVFSFEQPERYPDLAPYVMILPEGPQPVVYNVSNPVMLEDQETFDALLASLSFQPSISVAYPSADGKGVRQGMDSLRVRNDGTVLFQTAERANARYPVRYAGERPSLTEQVETARALLQSGLKPWCGEADFYCIGTEATKEGALVVYFGYLLNGCAVDVGENGYAARVVVDGDYVSEFEMHYRRYEATQTVSPVLPEEQAVAAMSALNKGGAELLLRYLDTGGSQVKAYWTAK